MIINETEYRKLLKGDIRGCFVFFGAEDYLKSYAIKATAQKLCPDEGLSFFNYATVDFPDFDLGALQMTLDAPPMMADCKLTVLKSFNFGGIKPTEQEGLLKLLAEHKEDRSNLLIISVIPDGLDVGYLPKKPSALFKKLCEAATAVNFEPNTPAKLVGWVARHFEHEKISADPRTAAFMVEYCGTSMYKLSSEIEKLAAYLHFNGKDRVSEEDIRYVCVSENEFEPFSLSNALLKDNKAEALKSLDAMKFKQVKPEYVLAELSALYSNLYMCKLLKANGADKPLISKMLKLHEFKAGLYLAAVENTPIKELERRLSLCLDADLAMKTYAKRNYEQIEKLVCLL